MKREFRDTMIAAQDFPGLVDFYVKFAGFTISQKTKDFVMLTDTATKQNLCITNGNSVTATSPGFAVDNIDAAVKDIEKMGGSVVRRWEFAGMKGANCRDPEGNEIMAWQGEHK